MALYRYDKKLKKVVPIDEVPVKFDNTKNYVNMRTTWSGTTKVEFNTTTMEDSIKAINGGK